MNILENSLMKEFENEIINEKKKIHIYRIRRTEKKYFTKIENISNDKKKLNKKMRKKFQLLVL